LNSTFPRYSTRSALANAHCCAGNDVHAQRHFCDAEAIQAKSHPMLPVLYSVAGFQFCDFLLSGSERAAWRTFVFSRPPDSQEFLAATNYCGFVLQRAGRTLTFSEVGNAPVLTHALDHLSLGRAALY